MKSLQALSNEMLPWIEAELRQDVRRASGAGLDEMVAMLAYHMGWEGEDGQPCGAEARGKRIRPLLTLLCAAAAGGEWKRALPGAAAVELIHNFSLAHDDIQDQSPLRRGRPTLWTRWGVAQALNAGDTLFALGQLAVLRLRETVSMQAALLASQALQETCLALTQGQYLDLSYEGREDLDETDYWPMVAGKTAALLSACTYIGALAAQAQPEVCQAYRAFGRLLGLAFQVKDDLLGVWGDAAAIGKSTASDLVSGKKSLPALYGLSQQGAFARRWMQGGVREDEAPQLAALLEAEGARRYAQQQADRLTHEALQALAEARPAGEAGQALVALAERLLKRET